MVDLLLDTTPRRMPQSGAWHSPEASTSNNHFRTGSVPPMRRPKIFRSTLHSLRSCTCCGMQRAPLLTFCSNFRRQVISHSRPRWPPVRPGIFQILNNTQGLDSLAPLRLSLNWMALKGIIGALLLRSDAQPARQCATSSRGGDITGPTLTPVPSFGKTTGARRSDLIGRVKCVKPVC